MGAKKTKDKKAKSTAVEKHTPAGVPAKMLDQFREAAGAGLESLTTADLQMPRLKLLQEISPELDEENQDKFIDGAEAGQFLNTVTGDLYGELEIIPCAIRRTAVVFTKRDLGGGWVGEFDSLEDAEDVVNPQIHEAQETVNIPVLFRVPGTEDFSKAMLNFTRSGLSFARTFASRLMSLKVGEGAERFTPPIFSTIWTLGSVSVKSKKGKYKTYDVSYVGLVDDEGTYETAEDFGTAYVNAPLRSTLAVPMGDDDEDDDNPAF